MPTYHIIGAGLAGLSAAIHLLPHGRVHLYEASAQAGGRCRSYFDPVLQCEIDNGNHLVLAANREVMQYLKRIDSHDSLLSVGSAYPFHDIQSAETWQACLPYGMTYLTPRAVHDLLRCLLLHKSRTVAECFSPHSVHYQRIIMPLCLAALNTHPKSASTAMLSTIIRRLLLSGIKGGESWIPRQNLQETFIAPAARTIIQNGGSVRFNARLKGWASHENSLSALQFDDSDVELNAGDVIILACPPWISAQLLPQITVPNQFEPIVNGHFLFPHRQQNGLTGLTGGTSDWIFWREGLASTTTSAASRLDTLDHDMLAARLWGDICAVLGEALPLPPYRILIEKRATFTATNAQAARRPKQATDFENLFLAGDYTASPLPATMESAILSGKTAAALALKCKPMEVK